MQLLEILDPRVRGSFRWPFLVELARSRSRVQDLIQRPIVPLVRRDGGYGDVIVGRCASAHVCIAQASISLSHAIFRPALDGSWELIDDASTNGTFVNGVRLAPGVAVRLVEGSIVRLGSRKYAFGSARLRALLGRLVAERARRAG